MTAGYEVALAREGELVGGADQSQNHLTLAFVAGGVEHYDGCGRLARVYEEVGFSPPRTLGGLGEWNRQGGVQAEVPLGVHVTELAVRP